MLALFTRRQTTPEPDTKESAAPAPLMRFLTQGGAEVHVTRVGTYTYKGYGRSWGEHDDRWTCHGCEQGSGQHDHYTPHQIRDAANTHAETCRSMPKTTP